MNAETAPDSAQQSLAPAVLPVSMLNREVARLLERSYPLLWVTGEVSNFTRAASGHCYFSLKDERAQVRAVMFRSRARAVGELLRNGQRVQALAAVSLYEARGEFQLNVESLRMAGEGDLHQAFLALRTKLQGEGLFDEALRRPLPAQVTTVGVITSLQAAALRDVLATLAKRSPQIQVVIYPSPVQGEQAAASLVDAIGLAEQDQRADVLLIVRGGGSIEDLWSFNDEALARRIRSCRLPVVVGVGHESDVTIADFVADYRAATPTAAAAAIAPDRSTSLAQLANQAWALQRAFERAQQWRMQRLDLAVRGLPTPRLQWRARLDRVSLATDRLVRVARQAEGERVARLRHVAQTLRMPEFAQLGGRIDQLARRLALASDRRIEQLGARERGLAGRLNAVGPLAVLARGYAVISDQRGRALSSVNDVAPGSLIRARLADGEFAARVESPDKHGESPT